MKKSTYTVTRFDYYDGFYVEVIPYTIGNTKRVQFCLYDGISDFKNFMFDYPYKDAPKSAWKSLILATINEHIEYFKNDLLVRQNSYINASDD